jgi:pimeloyl-ACP methyl ester carboxylesterase
MPAMVEGAGVPLAVYERGEGTPVLLIHDIAGDAEALATLAEGLAAQARVIAYDRRGYGGSGAPEPYEATTVHEQAEDAAALLGALNVAAAVVHGEGLGALVALDLLVRRADLVRSAVLVDAPLFAFVPEATEVLSTQRLLLEEALREGGPELAVERLLGPGAPPDVVGRARVAHRAVFADVAGLTSWPVTRAQLRAIAAPVVVSTSSASPFHVVRASDALAELLPAARRDYGGDAATALRSLL